MYYLQVDHKYNMILGCDILSKLNIDLCFSDNKIRGNEGSYKGCKTQMKDVSKINFNASSNWIKDEIFQSK